MPKNAIDRRIPRTRAMLQDALCALLRKKRYEVITVDDICAVANVGRSTFYAHYRSKDDLKRSGLDSLHRVLAERQKAARANHHDVPDRCLGFSLSMFEHAREHVDHYRTLVGGRGSAVALAKVREMVTDLVRDEFGSMRNRSSAEAIPREVIVQYVVGAFMAVLIWWLEEDGAKLPPERIDAIFRRLSTQGIAQP